MGPIEITIIVLCVLIVLGVLATFIYKKAKGLPTGDCGCCGKKGNKLLKSYHKKYKNNSSSCGCGCCCNETKQEEVESSECCCCSKDEKKQ